MLSESYSPYIITDFYEKYKVFMKIRHILDNKKKVAATLAGAAAAGLLNGIFGAGGGIILVYLYSKLIDDGRDLFASVVMSAAAMSAVSAVTYLFDGAVDTSLLARYAIPALVGGAIGGLVVDKVKTGWLRMIFAVLLIVSGINMAF